MKYLDLWLRFIDTQEVIPLFEEPTVPYKVPQLRSLDMEHLPPAMTRLLCHRDVSKAKELGSVNDVKRTLELLDSYDEKVFLREVYARLLCLEADNECSVDGSQLSRCLLDFLPVAPYLTDLFFKSSTWKRHHEILEPHLDSNILAILEELVLSTNLMPDFIRGPLRLLLKECKRMSVQKLAKLIELIALSVHQAETALDLLLEIIEPETSRLLVGSPEVTSRCVKSFIGIALDHIDEAGQNKKTIGEALRLAPDGNNEGREAVKTNVRVDSPLKKVLKMGDHVRFIASGPPENAPFAKPYQMDAVVLRADLGEATFRCVHHPPAYLQDCTWNLVHCGSFVTTKTMADALATFYDAKASCCRLFRPLLGLEDTAQSANADTTLSYSAHPGLNDSQNRALEAAMSSPLTFLWGPPGTGKTHTIVVILMQLLLALPKKRLLVAAPTHNAVDNILRKFIKEKGPEVTNTTPLRVSTSVGVSAPLPHLCDDP